MALAALVPFDSTIAFAYPAHARPLLLHDGLGNSAPANSLSAYLQSTYALDPFYLACARQVQPGLYRMRDVAPDRFFEGEYVHAWDVHPCISMNSGSLAEEIGFLTRLPSGAMVAFSLMRGNKRDPFSESEMAVLRSVAPVVAALIGRQWSDLGSVAPVQAAADPFARFSDNRLTARQAEIVKLALRGHGNAAIGSLLGIAVGTVKIHRKEIYRRLGIRSQAELFHRFIADALSPEAAENRPPQPPGVGPSGWSGPASRTGRGC